MTLQCCEQGDSPTFAEGTQGRGTEASSGRWGASSDGSLDEGISETNTLG